MKRRIMLLGALIVLLVPSIILAQGTGGTGSYGGTVPATFAITNTSNGSLSGTLGDFTMTIGKGTLATPTAMQVRLRSNAAYKLTANSAVTSGITDGTATAAGHDAQAIKTGDIGFGITAALDVTGASVVNGGETPSRTDTIAIGYDVTAGWPSVSNGHTPSFDKTLHSIYGSDIQILQGDRISASGDNGSDDNFILLTLGVAVLPQYWTPGAFSGTVTLTIAAAS